jgi:RNA polymerase sigma-70 factor (ECF subfamily)
VFREEHGRAVAVLVRSFGDIDIAEDAVQDAFAAAVERWPSAGVPPCPAGWINHDARNRAIDRLRRGHRALIGTPRRRSCISANSRAMRSVFKTTGCG